MTDEEIEEIARVSAERHDRPDKAIEDDTIVIPADSLTITGTIVHAWRIRSTRF